MGKDKYIEGQEFFRVSKIHISATNSSDAEEKITMAAISSKGGYICVSNVRMCMYADKHPNYADLMEHSFMNLPDGMPLTWCGHWWGLKNVNRTCGPDIFKKMLTFGQNDLKHCLLGDTQEVLDKIVDTYNRGDSKKIVEAYALPFAKVEDFDYEGIAQRVRESGANVVWTAMRAPKQDEFNQKLSKLVPNVVCIGVGRAFRTSIGEFKEIPKWATKLGLSGLWLLRGSLWNEIPFYSSAIMFLIKVFFQIHWRKFRGISYYK